MANSKKPRHYYPDLDHLRSQIVCPPRTPGSLGINDAADPNRLSLLGDTQGPLGCSDWGEPRHFIMPEMKIINEWFNESKVHVLPHEQHGRLYPAGVKNEVLDAAVKFLVKAESVPSKPYYPRIGQSGMTIGVGYDIGQQVEKVFREDWAELDRITPVNSPLKNPVDRLAQAAKDSPLKPKTPDELKNFVKQVEDIQIPVDLSLKVHRKIVSRYYDDSARTFKGLAELPQGVQVALISLVFNRGSGVKKKKGSNNEIDDRWEMRELQNAIRNKDLVWIYWYFESMRRIWNNSEDQELVKRRNKELDLIRPYVIEDLIVEAMLQGTK